MPSCVVLNCKNTTAKGFRLFRLPTGERNAGRRQIWTNLIARPSLYGDARVCECHFSDDQFETARMDGKKKLKPNAFPDLLDLSTTNDCMNNKTKRTEEVLLPECSHLTSNGILKVEDISHDEDECMMNGSVFEDSFGTSAIVEELDDDPLKNEPFESTTCLVEKLKNKLKSALRKCRYYERKLKQKSPTNLEKIFNKDQLEFLETDTRKGTMWSEDTITKGLKLYMACGTEGYNEIRRQKLPYPSIRTLQHRIRSLKLKSGILEDRKLLTRKKRCNSNIRRNGH